MSEPDFRIAEADTAIPRRLKKKGASDNAQVTAVWEAIQQIVPLATLHELIERTMGEMRHVTKGKRAAFGWSGGKDSIALAWLCQEMGIEDGVMGMVGKLEFPAFLRWAEVAKPPGVVIRSNDALDLAFLRDNPKYLFPRNSKDGFFWTLNGTRRAQHLYNQEFKPDMLIFGRRRADGNWIAPNTPYGQHMDAKGMTQYCPLRDWSHEAVFALCSYYAAALHGMPPTYRYANGWISGTGPWPGRQQMPSVRDGWALTYAADPELVHTAAEVIPSAAAYLLEMRVA